MKKIFIPVLFLSVASFGQVFESIDALEFLPANPSSLDTVYVVTHVTTIDTGVYLGAQVIELGDHFRIESCYFNGSPTGYTDNYYDTLSLGINDMGLHEILYVVYQSEHDMSCSLHLDSVLIQDSFSILVSSVEETSPESLILYPNPVTNGVVYIQATGTSEQLTFKLYNVQGEVVLEGFPNQNGAINVSDYHGIYFLGIYEETEVVRKKILIF
jgi:hypothetical protein